MVVKKILLLVSFLIALLVPSLIARAYDAPSVYVKEMNIKQSSLNEGNNIEGDFLIWNAENEIASGLSYSISLDQGRDVFNKKMYFASESINADKTLRQTFSYPIPKIFPAGDYDFKIQIFSQSGMSLGWKTLPVKIKGTGIYLNITDSYILQDGKKIDSGAGASFNPGSAPKIRFTVYNPSAKKIDFKAQATAYSSFEKPIELDQILSQDYSVDPKKAKEIELDMPKYQTPGSYLAKIILLSQGAAISKAENFIWIIKGASARILNVSISSESLEAGKEIKASVDFSGIAEGAGSREAELSINLYDEKTKKNLATSEKTITLDSNIKTEVISLTSNTASGKFTGEAKITKDGKELSSYSIGAKDSGVNSGMLDNLKKYIIAFFVLIFIIFIILFFMKYSRNGEKMFLLLVLIGAGLFGAGIGGAAAYSDLIISQNKPATNDIVDYGSILNYKGSIGTNVSTDINSVKDMNIINSVCDFAYSNCIVIGNKIDYAVAPSGVAYDIANNKLYVLDGASLKERILKVNPSDKSTEEIFASGIFSLPQDIFYANNYLFVADTGNNRIVQFNLGTNTVERTFLSGGAGDINFIQPQGVFYFAPYLFVADTGGNRVVRINTNTNAWDSYSLPGNFALLVPSDVSYDPVLKDVYVADTGNNRIVKFRINGAGAIIGGSLEEIITDGVETLSGPKSIFYSAPDLYITNTISSRVVSLNPNDNSVPWVVLGTGIQGSGTEQFNSPSGIFYYNFNIYVADRANQRAVKFDPADINDTWSTYNFSVGSYDINTYIPTSASFDPGFVFEASTNSFYAKIEVTAVFTDNTSKNINSFTKIILSSAAAITPVSCSLYAIQDTDEDDSRLITIDPISVAVNVLGEYNGYDIENLDIDPVTNKIYVATDQADPGKSKKGMIYLADASDGDLTAVGVAKIGGVTPINGIVALSFNPIDGTLWAWSKEDNQGLIKIEINRATTIPTLGAVTRILGPSNLDLGGLAWNNDGTVLYGVSKRKLYKYRPMPNDFQEITGNLPGSAETEALDITTDGNLYVAKHDYDVLYTVDVNGNEVSSLNLDDEYDIEGISWPGGCTPGGVPIVSDLEVVDPTPLQLCDAAGYTFKFKFTDIGDTGSQYQIQVADNDPSFAAGSLVVDKCGSGNVSGAACANIPGVLIIPSGITTSVLFPLAYPSSAHPPAPNKLAFGVDRYYYRVRVWDSAGNSSAWKEYDSNPFSSIDHPYPKVGFTQPSGNLVINMPYSFNAVGSMCYKKVGNNVVADITKCNWNWDFGDGLPATAENFKSDPEYSYTTEGSYTVTLTVKDSDNNECSLSKPPLNTKRANWIEVIPTN